MVSINRGCRTLSCNALRNSWMQLVKAESLTVVSGQTELKDLFLADNLTGALGKQAKQRERLRSNSHFPRRASQPLDTIKLIPIETKHPNTLPFGTKRGGILARPHLAGILVSLTRRGWEIVDSGWIVLQNSQKFPIFLLRLDPKADARIYRNIVLAP